MNYLKNDERFLAFIQESNKIEGILRSPLDAEIDAHVALLSQQVLTVFDVEAFVSAIAPGHKLRRQVGVDVRVGNHVAPLGGAQIENKLKVILAEANQGANTLLIHQRYENLHPFTDGNGRSGRAIWLWQAMKNARLYEALALGFLHHWYYLSLSNWDGRAK